MLSDLTQQAMRGDREAFTSLASIVGDRMYAVAYRIVRDPHRAEDAVQQAMLAAWRQLPSLRDPDRVEAWLHRLLVHACYAEIRREGRWKPALRVLGDWDVPEPDSTLTVDARDELERAFRRLTAEQRTVLVLHHYLGLTGAEISERLGISAGTVRSRLHYARQAMRAALEADARRVATGGMA